MKTNLLNHCFFILLLVTALFHSNKTFSQVAEWRLVLNNYNSTDPDGAGPAKGSFQFSLEMRAASSTITTKEITVGYSFDSTKVMVPSTANLQTTNATPSNITVSQAFINAGYLTYNNVNQANIKKSVAGGQNFSKTTSGSLDQGSITLTTTWVPAFKVTLWALSSVKPEGGYLMVHSSSIGSPGGFGNYDLLDVNDNVVQVNSQTFTTPLMLGSDQAMPITLSKFNAGCTSAGAFLNWETLSENNNDHFEVEKSTNGTSGWTSIANVKATGNSTGLKQYQFTDVQYGSSAYYRIRQVDVDGQYTYSAISKTDCDNKVTKLVVYPIPAQNVMNIVLTAERNGKATIKLLDIAGRVYRLQKVDLLKGSNKIEMNVSQFVSGNYILRVEKDNEVQTKEVIIK